jgi:hypothetical protein
VARVVTAISLLLAGGLFAAYGVLAPTFGEEGGSTYVTFAGTRVDAHLAGAISLAFGLFVVAAAVAVLRSGRLRS